MTTERESEKGRQGEREMGATIEAKRKEGGKKEKIRERAKDRERWK